MKKKNCRRNRKGSVLLSVICFGTVCLMLAATALKIASASMKVSNDNVRKTQAEITAEDYLQGFISTLVSKTDPSKTDYTQLQTLAGADADHPTVIDASLIDATNTNVANDTNGGSCKILVYNTPDGNITVESQATYAGVTKSSSAVFSSQVKSEYDSDNVIESGEEFINGSNDNVISAPVDGGILIEDKEKTNVTKIMNNATYNTHIYTNTNICLGKNTNVDYTDAIVKERKTAPTITAVGNIFAGQAQVYTDVGKTDKNKNNSSWKVTSDSYPASDYLNKDGYLNTESAMVITQYSRFGKPGKPIDMYCTQGILGEIPQEYYDASGNKVDCSDIYKQADPLSPTSIVQNNGNLSDDMLYGNFYCQKGSSVKQNGNLYVATTQPATIHGDLYVDGDIIIKKGGLKVTGNVYCNGTVVNKSSCTFTYSGTISSFSPSTGGFARNSKPSMDYAASSYKPGDKSTDPTVNESPTIMFPSSYKEFSPNELYNNPSKDTIAKVKQGYQDAYSKTCTLTESTVGTKTITESCKLTVDQTSGEKFNGKTITVELSNKNIYLLLPYSSTKKTTDSVNCLNTKILIDKTKATSDDIFCYIMFYDPDNGSKDFNYYSAKYNSSGSLVSGSGIQPSTDEKYQYKLYARNDNDHFLIQEKTKDGTFQSIKDDRSKVEKWRSNTFMLLPDKMKVTHSENHTPSVQCIVYGPNADFEFHGTSQCYLYGQVKVNKFKFQQQTGGHHSVINCRPASGSILGSIGAGAGTDKVELAYFTQYKRK